MWPSLTPAGDAAKSSGPGYELRYNPDLHCNGDSTTITIRLTDPATGQPVAGHNLMFSFPGVFLGPGGETIESPLNVVTNRRGVARVRVQPIDEQGTGWNVWVFGVPGSDRPLWVKGACDFNGDPANTIQGSIFEDKNANGVQDPRERPIRGKRLSVSRGGLHYFYILPHWQRTDSQGAFAFVGVPLTSPPDHPISGQWLLCVTDALSIVTASVNGAAPAGIWEDGSCFSFFIQPGANTLTIGVTRTHGH